MGLGPYPSGNCVYQAPYWKFLLLTSLAALVHNLLIHMHCYNMGNGLNLDEVGVKRCSAYQWVYKRYAARNARRPEYSAGSQRISVISVA